MIDGQEELLEQAKGVLAANDRGGFTAPAEGLYPHQWLWDSCFVAIGMAQYDVKRAQEEVLNILRGQWSNGMIPHMIFADGDQHRQDRNVWRSWLNPHAPDNVATSGITQPPVLAEAVVRIGKQLPLAERRSWYQTVLPALIAHHEWLYAERDPHQEGLVLLIHPYETGLDNTPPWIAELHQHNKPWWAKLLLQTHADLIINFFRRDTTRVAPGERMSNVEALLYYIVIKRLRRKAYNIETILNHSMFAIEDLTFNSIFIRANRLLREIAKSIKHELPDELLDNMRKTEDALDNLWDAYSGQYFSRNFVTHKLIKELSIATLMPLYSGAVTPERAAQLVNLLKDTQEYGTRYPIPSVPISSHWFHELGYWQGPTWVNMNWFIIDGLKRYGYDDIADAIRSRTLKMVEKSGCYEYFSPLNGHPAGARNFSWTASLTIDLIKSPIKKS
jgi:hypothetical protein